jgi:YesN/AraC family two-component response regulator
MTMPYTIMIVDDDDELREELREVFHQYRVVEAESGEQALRLLSKPHEVDLVILDEVMPGAHGTEVLRAIKAAAPGLGIIMLTGNASKDVAVEALRGHADEFIEKPPDIARMQRIVAAHLASRPGQTPLNEAGIRRKIEHVQQLLQRNVDKKATLNDLAAAVCLSPKYLSRAFAEVTGQGFNDYRAGLKIARAKQLLETTDHTVEWISEHLGYQNPESFIRQFKKQTKLTPSKYREKRHASRRA